MGMFYWITGRVDDVLNVSGHRIGSAEVEHCLVKQSEHVAEAAVVGSPHDIKGECIFCYVILKVGVEETVEVLSHLRSSVRSGIGAFATPEKIIAVSGLPKTRSGKIMRRLLRKLAACDFDNFGDTSTLADPKVVEEIKQKMIGLTSIATI